MLPWPPPSHIGIELPRVVTGINTALLLLSGYTIFQAHRAIQGDRVKQLRRWLLITGVLDCSFSVYRAVNGYNSFGMVSRSNRVYTAVFFMSLSDVMPFMC